MPASYRLRVTTLLFSSVVFLALIVPALSQRPIGPSDHDSDSDGGEHIVDTYWNPLFTPERYVQALEHVARMPDEFSGKGASSLMTATRWEGIGPIGVRISPTLSYFGRIRTIRWYSNPVTSNTETFIGASSGGIWKANFAFVARVWTSLGDNLPNPSVGAILVDSVDPNTMWVGSGDWARYGGSGLYKTTNRGGSWTRKEIEYYDALPWAITGMEYGASRSIMYLSTYSGFFRSSDGGESWRIGNIRSRADNLSFFSMAVDPLNRANVYITQARGGGVYKSTDNGVNFDAINTGLDLGRMGPTQPITIAASSPNILYLAGGDTSGNTGLIYKTTDGGANWRATGTPLPYIAAGQDFHAHAISVAPNDPNKVYVGAIGFMRSTNGGDTWEWRESGHSDITSIEFLPSDPNYVYVLSDGGIFVHNDATGQVRSNAEAFIPSAPIQAYSLESAWSNQKVLVSGTQDNGTLLTERGGDQNELWRSIGGCDGANTIAVHPNNPNLIFYNSWCGPSNPRLRSRDMGRTHEDISQGLAEIYYTPIRMNKSGSNYLLTVTREKIYLSKDSGASWNAGTTAPVDFAADEPPRMLYVSNHGGSTIHAYVQFWHDPARSWDGTKMKVFTGTGWDLVASTVRMPGREPINSVTVDRWTSATAYVSTSTPNVRIYRTTNAGGYWQNITGNMPDVNISEIVASPTDSRTMYVATDVGMFKTRTDGTTWYRYQHGLPIVGVSNLDYIRGAEVDTLRIATFGRGYWHRILRGDDPLAYMLDSSVRASVALLDVGVIRRGSQIPPLPDTVITVGASGVIGRSDDGARSFRFDVLPQDILLRGVAVSDCTHVTAVGDAGTIIHSNTAAREWQQVESGVSVSLRGITFLGADGWAIGDDGVILKSTNSGGIWSRVNNEKGVTLKSIWFTDLLNGWVVGEGLNKNQQTEPKMYRTTDGGTSWLLWQTPPVSFTALQMYDGNLGYATGDNGILYLTTDGGSSWTPKPSGFKTTFTDLAIVSPRLVYVTTSDGRVMYTDDDGKSWKIDEDVQSRGSLNSITLGTHDLIAVGDSDVVRVRFGDEPPLDTIGKPPLIDNFPTRFPQPFELRSSGVDDRSVGNAVRIEAIVPNPMTDATTIRFMVPRRSQATLTIYTMLGVPIATLREQDLDAGTQSATWDGRDANGVLVAAGTYLVRIETGDGIATGWIALVR